MPSGARGGVFHLGYKLAITAHEVGGERTRSGISARRGPGAGQLGGPSRIGENSCSVIDLVERPVGEADEVWH